MTFSKKCLSSLRKAIADITQKTSLDEV